MRRDPSRSGSGDARDDSCADDRVVVVEGGELPSRYGDDGLVQREREPLRRRRDGGADGRRTVSQLRLGTRDGHVQTASRLDSRGPEGFPRTDDDRVRGSVRPEDVERPLGDHTETAALARGEPPVAVVTAERPTGLVDD